MASDPGAVTPMQLYRLYWVGGGSAGEIVDFAPDAPTLQATVEANPSRYGLPCERPIVGRAKRILTAEIELDAA